MTLAALAVGGCGRAVIISGADGAETDDATGGITAATNPSDPTRPNPTNPTAGGCVVDDDCPGYYYICVDGRCYYNCPFECCYEDCYYYEECFYHEDCNEDRYCDYYVCAIASAMPDCGVPPRTVIPLPDASNNGAMSLAFLDAGGFGGESLAIAGNSVEVLLSPSANLEFLLPFAGAGVDIATGPLFPGGGDGIVVADSAGGQLIVNHRAIDDWQSFVIDDFGRDLELGDFNADGAADLALVTEAGSLRLHIGELSPMLNVLDLFLDVGAIASGSFNGDTVADLVFHQSGRSFAWFGNPMLSASVDFELSDSSGAQLRRFAVGDFDGDTFDDIAGVIPRGSSTLLHVWRGFGDGSFTDPRISLLPGSYVAAISADIDGDNRDELVLGADFEGVTLVSDALGPGACYGRYNDPASANAIAAGNWNMLAGDELAIGGARVIWEF